MEKDKLKQYCDMYSDAWNMFLLGAEHLENGAGESFWQHIKDTGNDIYKKHRSINKVLALDLVKATYNAIEDEYTRYAITSHNLIGDQITFDKLIVKDR